MREGWKAFWLAFAVTGAVLTPFIAGTALAAKSQKQPAAESESNVVIAQPDEDNSLTVLAVTADEPQAFVLVRLDAGQNRLQILVIPGQSVVKNGQTSLTLAESYAAAGPARAAALLGDTLGITIDRYLAATGDTWAKLLSGAGTARVGLSGSMTAQQLSAAGMPGTVREWTPNAAHAFLARLDAQNTELITPFTAASARAVLWQGWARQSIERLPTLLPDNIRSQSGSLLTNFSGTDLLTLGETLEFLANGKATPDANPIPGTWNAAAARYEFDDASLDAVKALYSEAATSDASEAESVP